MSKRNKACYIIGTILIIGSIILLATTFLKAKPHDDRQSITIYYEEGKDAPVSGVHHMNHSKHQAKQNLLLLLVLRASERKQSLKQSATI